MSDFQKAAAALFDQRLNQMVDKVGLPDIRSQERLRCGARVIHRRAEIIPSSKARKYTVHMATVGIIGLISFGNFADMPIEDLADDYLAHTMLKLNIDEDGTPHPDMPIIDNAENIDVEAEMMVWLRTTFLEYMEERINEKDVR